MKKILVILMLMVLALTVFGEDFVIKYRAPESKLDKRFDYPLELIKMAMEKTKKEYGAYKLEPSKQMNFKRAAYEVSKTKNFIYETTASDENEKNLLSIKIPIAKGLYGYRIFLIDKDKKDLFKKINTIEDLKKIRIGQGKGWLDPLILEDENFNVVLGNNYEGLFKMLVTDKFDAFARGVNEAFQERDQRIDKISDLAVEETLCLYYPLPRYFYTSKESTLLAERMTKGLEMMIKDGSFDKIWLKYNKKFLDQADLKNRKIFRIKNNHVPASVPLDEKKYWYVP